MKEFPKIADDIEINEFEDSYVICQKEKDKVHYLNKTAVLVLECCNGANSVFKIGSILQEAYDLPEIPEKEVNDCLDNLYKEGLIQ